MKHIYISVSVIWATKFIISCYFVLKLVELVYETHISQVKEEVSQLKSRLVELISLVQDVVSI